MAQTDIFLKIPGMESESTDDKHKGEIEIESFSWGEVNEGTAGQGGGSGAGKVAKQDMHFTKKLDKSSTRLFIACATGEHIPTATLTARKAGGGQQEYLKITIEGAFVSSYQFGGTATGDVIPVDQFAMNFTKLEFSYKEQKPDGSLGGEVKQKYDFGANKKI